MSPLSRTYIWAVMLAATLCVSVRRSMADDTQNHPSSTAVFDYYSLSLSWVPEFCAASTVARAEGECSSNIRPGLVVHGLWPQNNDGSYPVSCTSSPPVSSTIVQRMLPILPSSALVQHEWITHGTCSGLSPEGYFSAMKQLYTGLKLPEELKAPAKPKEMSPNEIEELLASANGAPKEAFRVACTAGELFSGLTVCVTKDLRYWACPGRSNCRSTLIKVLPVVTEVPDKITSAGPVDTGIAAGKVLIGGDPMAAAVISVYLMNKQGTAYVKAFHSETSGDGAFRISGLPYGNYILLISRRGTRFYQGKFTISQSNRIVDRMLLSAADTGISRSCTVPTRIFERTVAEISDPLIPESVFVYVGDMHHTAVTGTQSRLSVVVGDQSGVLRGTGKGDVSFTEAEFNQLNLVPSYGLTFEKVGDSVDFSIGDAKFVLIVTKVKHDIGTDDQSVIVEICSRST